MTPRTVCVPPAVIGGQQVGQRGQQIVVAAGAELDHGYPGGGMRHEDMQQPVAASSGVGGELLALPGDVVHGLVATG